MKMTYAALAVAAVLFAWPAAAQDNPTQERPFDGPSVTLIAGVDVDRLSSVHDTGALYGAQLGYDVQMNNTVLGLEAEATGSTAKGCRLFNAAPPSISYRACADAGRDLYIGGRLGFLAGATTMLYSKVGYTNARASVSVAYPGTPASNFAGSGNSDGFRVGAGVEKVVADRVVIRTEYRYSRYDRFTDRHQVVAGIGLRF